MTLATTTVPTPTGPFTIIARERTDGSAAVLASGWAADAPQLLERIGGARRLAAAAANDAAPRAAAPLDPVAIVQSDDLGPITDALAAYLDGDLSAIDAVPVEQAASPFMARAWEQLRAIPAGAPQTYAQLAASSGNPAAIRAAGSACARNTAALFVPCHRVLRSGGALGGFLYGLDVKRWLLAHEAEGAEAGPAPRVAEPAGAVAVAVAVS
ncbi:methylated-DNA--[protein]-cysteine S-methyltransferase [Conexibacter stalactiti]|uniref:Methylated-DNA--[protein]-cysteine S-methyltransferase n=1 Tax=Conexibacter stalactiti TaxID=1940611 RepID=A0ABU4HMK2_9ACTN|nr:methylated-DNA--[protein]-cysteine S-methyltransferase [Conexibacter stalactiti]MDW5594541.1 methylated-DNA--[protein]-cysteine S-methyltransferase [Conexibacter stalactiti]MEC5035183.1 methylated-DNA--[protein]-cysteine S-methyltransferase [Conexibacter stalactiti]